MSTAWYKPNSVPKKIRSWTSMLGKPTNERGDFFRSIEVWETTCVVTNMNNSSEAGGAGRSSADSGGDQNCRIPFSVLINPGNPSLSGVSKFSYFPVGGPEPPPSFTIGKDSHPIMGYVTQWGGMEVGNGMSFASNTVDGIVHQYGGKELRKECEAALSNTWTGGATKIDEGQAISTPAVGPKLREASGYDILVHTVPPFVDQDYRTTDGNLTTTGENANESEGMVGHNDFLLAECYHNSLRTAAAVSSSSTLLKVACPLLGAGCRGFPQDRAIEIAASATTQWMTKATTVNDLATEENEKTSSPNVIGTSNDTTNAQTHSTLWKKWFGGRKSIIHRPGALSSGDESSHKSSMTLAFGIPDSEIRKKLIEAIDREMESHLQ